MLVNSVSEIPEVKMQQLEAELAEATRLIEVLTEALKESEDRYNRQLENLKDEFLFFFRCLKNPLPYINHIYKVLCIC